VAVLLALQPDVLDARRARRALHLVHGALPRQVHRGAAVHARRHRRAPRADLRPLAAPRRAARVPLAALWAGAGRGRHVLAPRREAVQQRECAAVKVLLRLGVVHRAASTPAGPPPSRRRHRTGYPSCLHAHELAPLLGATCRAEDESPPPNRPGRVAAERARA